MFFLKMINNKNIFYYIFAAIIFAVLKYAYTLSSSDDLLFLLSPINKIITIITGEHSTYIENGYFFKNLNISIDKSCSGFNLWLLIFIMLSFLALKHIGKYKIFIIPISLFVAYVVSIFINVSRIFTSIVIQDKINNILPNHTIHEAIGIITNLIFLILIYIFTEKQLIKKS